MEKVKRESATSHGSTKQVEARGFFRPRVSLTMFALGITVFIVGLDASIVATAAPSISREFHVTDDIGWYGVAYDLGLCSMQPLAGKISTIVSVKRAFLSFLSLFLVGSLLCGIATGSVFFIIGRVISGIGAAGLASNALIILAVTVPLERRALYSHLLIGLFGVGTLIGPLTGGALTTVATWRWCFFVNLPIGVMSFASVAFFVTVHRLNSEETSSEENPRKKSKISIAIELANKLDIVGLLLFVPAICMLLIALMWAGHRYDWGSGVIIGLFIASAWFWTMFLTWELRLGATAMMPHSILLNRSALLTCFSAFFIMGGFIVFEYYLPEWFQIVKGATAVESGLMLMAALVSISLSSPISALVVKYTGYCNPNLFFGAILMTIGAGLLTTLEPDSSNLQWIGYQCFIGAGAGFAAPAPIDAMQALFDSKDGNQPVVMAQVFFWQYFGMSIFLSAGLTIFQNQLTDGLTSHGFSSGQIGTLLHAGTGGVRGITDGVSEEVASVVMQAYSDSITNVFVIAIGCFSTAFLCGLGWSWTSVKKVDPQSEKFSPERASSTDPFSDRYEINADGSSRDISSWPLPPQPTYKSTVRQPKHIKSFKTSLSHDDFASSLQKLLDDSQKQASSYQSAPTSQLRSAPYPYYRTSQRRPRSTTRPLSTASRPLSSSLFPWRSSMIPYPYTENSTPSVAENYESTPHYERQTARAAGKRVSWFPDSNRLAEPVESLNLDITSSNQDHMMERESKTWENPNRRTIG